MKKIAFAFSFFLTFVAFSNTTSAQTVIGNTTSTQQVKPGRAMLNVPTLTSEEQFMVLQSSVLNKVEGLAMSNWNPQNKQIILMYDLNKTNSDKIIEILGQNGYPATVYVASEKPKATSGK